MDRYEPRPLNETAWGIFDNLAQTFVAWVEGTRETMTRRADTYNATYQRVVEGRRLKDRA
jgi:hypothetical protein